MEKGSVRSSRCLKKTDDRGNMWQESLTQETHRKKTQSLNRRPCLGCIFHIPGAEVQSVGVTKNIINFLSVLKTTSPSFNSRASKEEETFKS